MRLRFLYRVPQRLAIRVLCRGVRGQEDLGADHAALAGVVAVLAVILAVEFLSGAVGGSGDDGLTGAPLDLRGVEMKEGYDRSPPSPAGSRALTSGREKTFSIRSKKSVSPMPLTTGAKHSMAAPRVMRRWFRFFRSPSVR